MDPPCGSDGEDDDREGDDDQRKPEAQHVTRHMRRRAGAGAIGVEAAVSRHNTTLMILVVLALVGFLSSVSIAKFAAPDSDRHVTEDQEGES